MKFLNIPSIDIFQGACVRLDQGSYDHATIYRDDPAETAAEFAEVCDRLHVVDLDGAMAGKPSNVEAIDKLIDRAKKANGKVEVQVGGGLRTADDIKATVERGASYVVVGTAAIRNKEFLDKACAAAPGKVLISLDAREGKLAISGWTEDTEIGVTEFAKDVASKDLAGIIHTDIHRDGMLSGANVEATAELAGLIDLPVFASGGVSSMDDIARMRETKIAGALIGKALYTDKITIRDLAQ